MPEITESRGMLLGEILIKRNVITREQLEEALNLQKEKKGRLGEHLIRLKYAKERDILMALSQQTGIPFQEKLSITDVLPEFIEKLPINYAKKNHVLPLRVSDSHVVVAISDPLRIFVLDDVASLLGMPVSPVLVSPAVLEDSINRVYDRTQSSAEKMMDDLEEEESLDIIAQELEEPTDLLESTDEAPIIRLVNSLLYQAVKERASDIHIEPFEKDISVRFRIDGILHEIIRPPKKFQSSIISRVKIMAKLNIAEKRLPQDGRIRVKIAGKDIDIRISTVPTTFGERVVMRLLDRTTVLYGLNEIGLDKEKLTTVEKLLQRNNGMILVTGPTGSGKTTTLYAFLNKRNSPDVNIITIEDPVEYQLKGIGQIQVNPKIDLTFANGLRSILRQDPDIIMVGEIRDLETAEIAIHASLTGHLVFSTLHTNDSAGAITRLIDMGIEPFLISSSLVAVIAQRLVRVLCPHCAEEYVPDEEELAKLYPATNSRKKVVLKRARGCSECMMTGYKGRTGIYELLLVDDEIRSLITRKTDSNTIKSVAIKKGMDILKVDGMKKVLQGITTIEEVLRVTQEEIV